MWRDVEHQRCAERGPADQPKCVFQQCVRAEVQPTGFVRICRFGHVDMEAESVLAFRLQEIWRLPQEMCDREKKPCLRLALGVHLSLAARGSRRKQKT